MVNKELKERIDTLRDDIYLTREDKNELVLAQRNMLWHKKQMEYWGDVIKLIKTQKV